MIRHLFAEPFTGKRLDTVIIERVRAATTRSYRVRFES